MSVAAEGWPPSEAAAAGAARLGAARLFTAASAGARSLAMFGGAVGTVVGLLAEDAALPGDASRRPRC